MVKLKTVITPSANFVVKGKYFYFHLVDNNGNSVARQKVTIKFNGKTYNKKSTHTVRLKSRSSLKLIKNIP